MKKRNMEVVGTNSIYGAGVYQFETKSDGKVLYVGSATDIGDSALSRHLYNLRRGYYIDSNKRPLQEAWDIDNLVMRVIHSSAHNNEVKSMNIQQKEDLQKALGIIEQTYIYMYRDTVCNKMMKVSKWSTSPTKEISNRRSVMNQGSNNPNQKYDESMVANILWLKEQGVKPKQIIKLLLEQDINVSNSYISSIGLTRWIYIKPVKPIWYSKVAE